eukprot:5482390-Pyramimonas_sp.AAC.1
MMVWRFALRVVRLVSRLLRPRRRGVRGRCGARRGARGQLRNVSRGRHSVHRRRCARRRCGAHWRW